jgi:hypothetical protein
VARTRIYGVVFLGNCIAPVVDDLLDDEISNPTNRVDTTGRKYPQEGYESFDTHTSTNCPQIITVTRDTNRGKMSIRG